RFLGGHRGVITQGTATRGHPAEAKIKDRHDNIHYLRVEPLEDDGVFPQGSDVTLIRKRGDKFFVI
ncbi:MAG: OB-fold-containig protein, partial [Paracoccaceae bacterium]